MRIDWDIKELQLVFIQHVETSVASHCKHFEWCVVSRLHINHVCIEAFRLFNINTIFTMTFTLLLVK